MTDEEAQAIAAGQDKRPRYAPGDRVQVVMPNTPYDGWRGEVRSVAALQTIQGTLVTYVYRLRGENLVYLELPEDHLSPAN